MPDAFARLRRVPVDAAPVPVRAAPASAVAALLGLGLLGLGLLGQGAGAAAAGQRASASASAGITLRATVPLICRLEVEEVAAPSAGGARRARVEEFCNGRDGFFVYATHAPLAADPGWRFVYGEREIAPSPGGATLLFDSDAPARATRTFAIRGTGRGAPPPADLALHIVPK